MYDYDEGRKEAAYLDKEKRIKAEKNRLTRIFKDADEKKQKVIHGLIERAAFMRIQLEDLEEDINLNGFTEWFAQGVNQEPYQRKRPSADQYNVMSASYAKVVKQLTDLLPKEVAGAVDDGFDGFVNGRGEI